MYKNMQYRFNKETLLNTLSVWDGYLKRKVHLIACGGTALTLMNLKESTKDIDLIIPNEKEYIYLVKTLKDLGYKNITGTGWARDKGLIFDLYVGKTIFTTELLESPLAEGNHVPYKEFSSVSLGILNYYDLMISKIFRFTSTDLEDCLALFKAKHKEIDIEKLKKRFLETSSYDISDEKNKRNFEYFLIILKKEKFKL
jgi:hypothetical protein